MRELNISEVTVVAGGEWSAYTIPAGLGGAVIGGIGSYIVGPKIYLSVASYLIGNSKQSRATLELAEVLGHYWVKPFCAVVGTIAGAALGTYYTYQNTPNE